MQRFPLLPTRRRTAGLLVGLVVAVGLTGCGGGGSGSGGSHETPEGAVRGYGEVLRDNDLSGIVEWVRPEDRDDVRRDLNDLPPDARVTVDEFKITGSEPRDEDTVRVRVLLIGKVCSEGRSQCADLGDEDFAVAERVDDKWYLENGVGILDD